MKARARLVPSTERGREWLAIGVLVLAVAWPFARAPRAQFGDDDLEYAVPFAHFVLGELTHGRWPTWNPATDGGLPLLAQQPWMGPIYPGLALFAVLDDGWALAAGYALHASLYAVGVFLLLRCVGFRRASAWLAAAALGLGSDVAVAWNRGYLHHLVSLSWIAWPILAFECGRLGERPRRAAVLGAIALGLAFLGGHTVSALQTALAFGLWASVTLAGDVVSAARRTDPAASARLLRALGVAVAIGFGALLLASVQLVPLRAVASTGTLPELREWKPWDLEMASPWRKVGYFLPGWETGRKGRDFVGLTPWMLAAVGVVARIRRERRDGGDETSDSPTVDARCNWAPLVTAGVMLSLSAGAHAPFFGLASAIVPALGVISYPYFFAPGIHLGLAWLAAWGLDALEAGAGRWVVAALGGGVAAAVTAVWSLRERIAADPLDHQGLIASVPHTLPIVVAVTMAVVLVASRRVAAGRGVWLLVMLAVLEIVDYRVRARVDKPRYSTEAYFHASDPLVQRLAGSTSLGRIWHVERTRFAGDWLLRRNGGLVLGYEEILRSSRVGSKRYAAWTEPLGSDVVWESALDVNDRAQRVTGGTPSLVVDERRLAILDALAVDRIVTDLVLTGGGAGAFAPTASDATGRVRLYQRVAGAAQRARLADAAEAGASLIVRGRRPGAFWLDVASERGATISLAENPLPGWGAALAGAAERGRRLAVRAADGDAPSLEIDVPPGAHALTVEYSASPIPALVSGITALVLAALAMARERSAGGWE